MAKSHQLLSVELPKLTKALEQLNPLNKNIFEEVAGIGKMRLEHGPEVMQKTLETIKHNPGLVTQEGKSVTRVLQEVSGDVAKSNLSQSQIKHFGKHILSEFAEQAKYMPLDALEAKLAKQSFFNPKWSKEEILKYVQDGYKSLRNKGLTGLQNYKVGDEIIKIFIKPDGTLDTAYGLHKLTIDYFKGL